jgi:type I restriction enzyme S subunit
VSKSAIEDFEIDLPPLFMQKKIASILSQIDNQIQRNNDMVHKLQVLAQTTYSRWFNQFEFPNKHGLPYKSSVGKMVWNNELKREIPEGWEVCELLDLIEWKSSSQPPKSDFVEQYKNGYIRFIQNRDYESNAHMTYIPLTTTTKTCTQYDIMIDKYGDAGRTRYGLEGAFNVALAKIEPKQPNQQELIRKYLEQNSIYHFLHNACMASTRASLNELVLQGLKIVVPDDEICSTFEVLMKSIIDQILEITNSTNKLNALKSKLLPLLINGQLKV